MDTRSLFRSFIKWVKWPAIFLFVLNLENFAEKFGWDKILIENWSPALNTVVAVLQSPWFQYPAVFVIGGSLVLYVDRVLARFDNRNDYDTSIDAKNDGFGHSEQQVLLNRIQEYAGPDYNVDIEFASVPQKPLAESVRSVFHLAKWKVNFHDRPRENEVPDYWAGVHVWGRNKHLVESIADALREAGIKGVHSSLRRNPHKQDHPKWSPVEHRVKIRIGHNSI